MSIVAALLYRIPLTSHLSPPLSSDVECFGAHLGVPQTANLGDGHGWVNQTMELRNDFGNDEIGTCWESLVGGNHFRLFRQNGPSANTGALFLAYVPLAIRSLRFLGSDRVSIAFPRRK